MNRDATVAGLIDAAAQAIRAANHRTIDTIGAHPVSDVYTMLGELSYLGHRLPQLCDQLAANLKHRHTLGGLRLDDDGQRRYQDPTQAIVLAGQALAAAATAAGQFGRAIDTAQNACAVIADTTALDAQDEANNEREDWQ